MKYLITLLLAAVFSTVLYSQSQVKIGKQIWMSKNLDVATFRNGDTIPEAKSISEWTTAGSKEQPAWCYYNYDPANGKKYGKLYNWFAVNDPRGLAPMGWHVPSEEEWIVIKLLLQGKGRYCAAGRAIKSKTGWSWYKGTNSSGFSGLPGGIISGSGYFSWLGEYGFWWSSSQLNGYPRFRSIDNRSDAIYSGNHSKDQGLSVRCIKD